MNKYIKSPLNYTGGKYKLLDKIIPLFPENIETFVDLFGGGFNVGANVEANKIIYNDCLIPICNLFEYIKNEPIEKLLTEIDSFIEKYNLSKENKEGYLKLREDYNNNPIDPIMFYTLVCYSFNNQIRFNKRDEFNMPFGQRGFNPFLRKKFILFAKRLKEINCEFYCGSFEDFILKDKDFVYCDPPYLGSIATYNENGGWTEKEENNLLELLDILDKREIKFALSNNLKYENPLLEKWSEKYKIHYLSADYSNCNYQKKDKSKSNEVLIVNY